MARSCVNGENFIVVLDGVVDFPAIILLVGDDAGDPFPFRMDGELLRPHRVKALGAEFRRDHGIAQQDIFLVNPEGIAVPRPL